MGEKILFVRPPSEALLFLGGSDQKTFGGHELELGMLYIAACLEREGADVKFLDMSIYKNPNKRLLKILKNNKFDFIGLTAYSSFIKTANEVAGVIKQHSDAKIVIGGAHASALPIETLERFENFDFLIYGEGEIPFIQILTKDYRKVNGVVWRKNGQIIKNPMPETLKDLDSLPFPARHLLDIEKYIPPVGNYRTLPSTGILTARGCPYQCTFCSRTGARLKDGLRLRSVENIIKEIKYCINEYGIHDFRIYDDTFVIPKKRLIKFCKEVIKNKLKIHWNCYSRVDTIDMEMLKLMKKAGCYHIKYGVEFGTEKWLELSKKRTTIKQAKIAMRDTKKVGIAAKASFMIGMPGETIEEIKDTIKFAEELNPTYTTFSVFVPMPGSEIFVRARQSGDLLTDNYDLYFSKSVKVLKSQLSPKILNKLIKEAYNKVYYSPRFLLHRLGHLMKNFSIYEIRSLFEGASLLVRK